MKKFILECSSTPCHPTVIFNGHGTVKENDKAVGGLVLLRDDFISLDTVVAFTQECCRNIHLLKNVELIFAQCYGHMYTSPDPRLNVKITHFTHDGKVKSVIMTQRDRMTNQVKRSIHAELNIFAEEKIKGTSAKRKNMHSDREIEISWFDIEF